RRARRAPRARRAQGREVELALLRRRRPGLVPRNPCVHPLRQGELLQGRVAEARAARRQGPGRALDRRPRGRARRSSDGALDQASRLDPRVDHGERKLREEVVKKARSTTGPSASERIDGRIAELGDWRGKTLARIRALIRKTDPEVVEEWKWMGVPV